ncbi:MAG: YggS family pyridoxal phosphate-dependent enzyme [Chromatiales bacterium]|nr:YggS family pyridoxal phosphate-dependent enzyme [Chromatiales bacterium]
MINIAPHLRAVRERIRAAEERFGRPPDSVQLLAVSKRHPVTALRAAHAQDQRRFGESYVQEALVKMDRLIDLDIEWHFIGPLQSNKTRPVAERFHWVHSVDRLKIARRLAEQRPITLGPLNVCLEVNLSGEKSKSGVSPDELPELAKTVDALTGLRLRGLMCIPAPEPDFRRQRQVFARLRRLVEQLSSDGLQLDTLSMGMSNDLEAAIAEGATIVRVGTAIFGPRGG